MFDFVASTTSTAIGMMFHKSPFQFVMGMVATNGKIWMHFSREREKLDDDMYRTWLDALTCDILHLHTYKPGQTPTFDSLSYEFVTELNLVALQSWENCRKFVTQDECFEWRKWNDEIHSCTNVKHTEWAHTTLLKSKINIEKFRAVFYDSCFPSGWWTLIEWNIDCE